MNPKTLFNTAERLFCMVALAMTVFATTAAAWAWQASEQPTVNANEVMPEVMPPYEPVAIPGKIEAEEYSAMSGADTETCLDSGGGRNLCNISNGCTVEYLVSVPKSDTYRIRYRVASASLCGQFRVSYTFDSSPGRPVVLPICVDTVSVPRTGGAQTWSDVTHYVSLPAKELRLMLGVITGGWNLNYLEISRAETVQGIGTIRYTDIEGGHFVLETVGKTYYPLNLDSAYRVDGAPVRFVGILRPDVVTIGMYGMPLQLTSIEMDGAPPTTRPNTTFLEHGRMQAQVIANSIGSYGHFVGEKSQREVYPAGSTFASMRTSSFENKAREFYNADAVRNLRLDFNVQVVRALMPSLPWIAEYYDLEFARVCTVIDAAIAENIYVVVAREASGLGAADLGACRTEKSALPSVRPIFSRLLA
jgi:hypothetical protein